MGTQPSSEMLSPSLATATPSMSLADDVSASPARMSRSQVLQHFDDVFSETPASEPQDIQAAFRLRYQVYCLDRQFEDATTFPQGIERDPYDDHSLHCLLKHRASESPIGTVRLVHPMATPTWFAQLPVAEYAPQESMEEILRLPAGSTAEVSRFAITRSAREILRGPERLLGRQMTGAAHLSSISEKLLPYMSLGLIRGLVRLSMQHGISHWCLAAEPCLLRRLGAFGLHFRNSGPLVEHRGLRQVCYANLKELLAQAEAEKPEFWNIITDGGVLLSGDLSRNAA